MAHGLGGLTGGHFLSLLPYLPSARRLLHVEHSHQGSGMAAQRRIQVIVPQQLCVPLLSLTVEMNTSEASSFVTSMLMG